MLTQLRRGLTLRCPNCASGTGVVTPSRPKLEITTGFTKFAVLPLTEIGDAELVKCSKCAHVATFEEWQKH